MPEQLGRFSPSAGCGPRPSLVLNGDGAARRHLCPVVATATGAPNAPEGAPGERLLSLNRQVAVLPPFRDAHPAPAVAC